MLKLALPKVNILETLSQSLYLEPYRPMSTRYLLSKGCVVEPLSANTVGRIKLDGVLWRARLPQSAVGVTLAEGTEVSILYRDELTLIVRPVSA